MNLQRKRYRQHTCTGHSVYTIYKHDCLQEMCPVNGKMKQIRRCFKPALFLIVNENFFTSLLEGKMKSRGQ